MYTTLFACFLVFLLSRWFIAGCIRTRDRDWEVAGAGCAVVFLIPSFITGVVVASILVIRRINT